MKTITKDIEIQGNGKLTLQKIDDGKGPYFRLTFVDREHSFILAGGDVADIVNFSDSIKDSIKDFTVEAKKIMEESNKPDTGTPS